MILKRVCLENIRSYTKQVIDFSESKILLAGDIGSGKSTILLAIEFALFGTLRGDLSGNALLRNGAKTGYVSLEFEIDKKNVMIHRSLKRTKTSVEQDSGYIIIDNIKEELTATELKSKVIDLLNYPKEYITKSKNLIYRFTVYTPQEDMKRILTEESETRTNILRKIFNIEKYERIKTNTASYTKFLREKQRAFEAVTKDFKEKKESLDERKKELEETEDAVGSLISKISKSESEVKENENNVKKYEKAMKDRTELLKIYSHNKASLEHKKKQIVLFEKEIEQIDELLNEKISETKDRSVDIELKEKEIQEKENNLKQILQDVAGIKTLINQSDLLSKKIKDIDTCPTCLQNVNEEHKAKIDEEENKKKEELSKKHEVHSKNIDKLEKDIKSLKEEITQFRKKQQEYLVAQQKIKIRKQRLEKKDSLNDNSIALKKEIVSLEQQQSAYDKVLKENKVEEDYNKARETFESFRKKHQELLLEESKLKERIAQINKYTAHLERDINSKIDASKKLENSKKMHSWFIDYFIPLVTNIEKHVMAKIHHDFDLLFQQWFSLLVDDDMLSASLDDSFTPLIQQNGYDIEFSHLSGGEKTACALAYRLALNKVINDIFTDAKTKDLLILDEPTDGFSDEQLDKMRDVLDQLDLKQILIVSHEQKIEGFVDDVIRINKDNHISKIV